MGRKRKKNRKKGSAEEQAAKRDAAASAAPEVVPSGDTAPVTLVHVAPAAAAEPAPLPSAPATPAPPSDPDEPVVEDLDADLDAADDDYASLVAQVAGLPGKTARPAAGPAQRSRPAKQPAPAEDLVEVLDLDDDEGASEAIDRLISQAVVGAPREEVTPEPEVPLIDLDADVTAAPPRARGSRPAPATAPPPSQLIEAAAAGGLDEADVPAMSLDLGEVSTPEARARLLAEALAHAEYKEARYRVPLADTGGAARWKGAAAGVVFLLAAAVAVSPPAWVRPEPPAQLNAAARTRDTRTALLLQAQQVEAFRVRSQRLPTSLDELPAALDGVRYARSGNRAYQLIAYESDGSTIVYDSANPAPPFRILMSAWAPEGTP